MNISFGRARFEKYFPIGNIHFNREKLEKRYQ